jgi:hypothetical protein
MEFAAKGAPHQLIAPADHKKPHYHFALTRFDILLASLQKTVIISASIF